MKTFLEFIAEDGEGVVPAMALSSANQVGTEDRDSVSGEPFKRKGIKLINRKNKVIPKETY